MTRSIPNSTEEEKDETDSQNSGNSEISSSETSSKEDRDSGSISFDETNERNQLKEPKTEINIEEDSIESEKDEVYCIYYV